MAHDEFPILHVLLRLLDNSRNDIYLLIDRKTDFSETFALKYSAVHVIKDRIDIRWGDYSQIEAEMLLFETAYGKGPYEYYHLLSGTDLPIKPVPAILKFFDDHAGKEFVGFVKTDEWKDKVLGWHLFTRFYRSKGLLARRLSGIRPGCEKVLNSLFPRKSDGIEFRKGANWVSITNGFCGYLLTKRKFIRKYFRHTLCADEIFLQTILWDSPFRAAIYSSDDEYSGNMREIDWNRGQPYIWGQNPEDTDILLNSPKLFARKFSSRHMGIVQEIIRYHEDRNPDLTFIS